MDQPRSDASIGFHSSVLSFFGRQPIFVDVGHHVSPPSFSTMFYLLFRC